MDTLIWTSLDGINWERVPDPDGTLSFAHISKPIAWEGGLAAIGNKCIGGEACDVAWTSPDGLIWSYSQLPTLEPLTTFHGVVERNPGLILWGSGHIAGEDEIPVGYFWTSTDGDTWQTHTADAEVFTWGLPVSKFIWYNGYLVGVGGSGDPDRAPAVYVWSP